MPANENDRSLNSLAAKAVPFLIALVIGLGSYAWYDMRDIVKQQAEDSSKRAQRIEDIYNSLQMQMRDFQSGLAVQEERTENNGDKIENLNSRMDRIEQKIMRLPNDPIAETRDVFQSAGTFQDAIWNGAGMFLNVEG